MMKQLIFVAALVTALGAGAAWAQQARRAYRSEGAAEHGARPDRAGRRAGARIGQPAQGGEGGRQAAAGRHLSGAADRRSRPTPDAKGQTEAAERWVEFVRGGKVVGREVATIVPQAEIGLVQKDTPPARNGAKVETLKGGDYVRVWINRGGNHYLIHLPAA